MTTTPHHPAITSNVYVHALPFADRLYLEQLAHAEFVRTGKRPRMADVISSLIECAAHDAARASSTKRGGRG